MATAPPVAVDVACVSVPVVFASVLVDSDDADADMEEAMEDAADEIADDAEAAGLLGGAMLVMIQCVQSMREGVGGVVLLPELREEVGDAVWYVESYLRFRCECEASKGGEDNG